MVTQVDFWNTAVLCWHLWQAQKTAFRRYCTVVTLVALADAEITLQHV
jgi:hypothetical protein